MIKWRSSKAINRLTLSHPNGDNEELQNSQGDKDQHHNNSNTTGNSKMLVGLLVLHDLGSAVNTEDGWR
jgi:hypothetical protein